MTNYTAILLRGHTPRDWPKQGWYWCLHHDELLEWTHDVGERIRYIHAEKLQDEQRRRCTMLRPVLGELPEAILTSGAAYRKALAACDRTRAAFDKAETAFDKAETAYNMARAANLPALIAQHNAEYPDTPWVGPTIFEGETA